jgi:membrane-associated phospholipid phosphatase
MHCISLNKPQSARRGQKHGIAKGDFARMKHTSLLIRTLAIALLLVSVTLPALADGFATGAVSATKPALGLGLLACLTSSKDSTEGMQRAMHATDAVLVSVGVAGLLKTSITLNSGSKYEHSFPSGHTAGAFAMATSLADAHPKSKWLYYTGAAVIGWASVKSGGHTWQDVVGGAVLGTAVGRSSVKSDDWMILGKTYRF